MATLSELKNSYVNKTGVASLLTDNQRQIAINNVMADSQNSGGFLGGLGYLGEKMGLGFLSSVEGIWDYAAGGIAKLLGNDDWAERQFANEWVNYDHADEWFNPSSGWQVAGDVAGGIGTSIPAIAGTVAGAAIIYFSGGTLSGVGAKLILGSISAGITGLSAAGNATKEAYKETGRLTGEEFGYGALSGATEAGVEFLTTGIGKGTGRIVSSFAKTAAKETAETVAKTGANAIFKQIGEDFVTEAFEEGLAEVLSPVYQRMTYNPNAENASPQEVAYASMVGGLSGMVMSGSSIGINAGVNTTVNYFSGKKASESGTYAGVIEAGRALAESESAHDTGIEAFQSARDTYNKLTESLKKNNGISTTEELLERVKAGNVTFRAKDLMYLGKLKRTSVMAHLHPYIERSAKGLVFNAENVAQRYASFGMTDANGKPLTFTAEEILSGIDASLVEKAKAGTFTDAEAKTFAKSLRKALSENSVLATLAVAEATGSIMMDTRRMAETMLNGETLANTADLNRLIEKGKPEEMQALGQALGIEDWSKVTIDELRTKVLEFNANGGISEFAEQSKRMRRALEQGAESAKPLPHLLRKNMQDGAYRYTSEDGAVNMAIFKEGNIYRLYDYDGGNISRALSVQDVNRVLKRFWTSGQTTTAESMQFTEETNLARETTEIDAYAVKNIPNYHSMSEPDKAAIRMTVRQARAHGISEEETLTFARVAARSGMNIVFDGARSSVGDASIQGNTIYINPDAPKERLRSRLLLHEAGHALLRRKDGKNLIAEAFKHIAPERSREVAQRYIDFCKKQGLSMEQYMPIVNEEITTAYIEDVLGDANAWEYILSEEPSMSQKILSFFRKAARDYSGDAKLSSEARKLLRTYKKLFADLSAQNQGNNALELTRQDERTKKAAKEIADRKAYRYSVDADLLEFVDSVSVMESKNAISKRKHTLGKISETHAKIVEDVLSSELGLNIDVGGYTVNIDGSAVKHIEEKHGANGSSDHSMQNKADVARIGWAVNNAESGYIARTQTGEIDYSAQYRNADGSPSPKIILEKSIGDGKFIVAECVLDTAAKKIHIISARKIKSGNGQVLNVKSNDFPQPTSETLLDGITATDSITENAEKSNPSDEKSSKKSPKNFAGDANVDTDTRYAIKYPNFSEADISRNMDAIADMEAVATIDASKLEKTGKSPMDTFNEYFNSLGNNITSETFGDIALPKSSAKSEIRHGITAEKIASIEAIPAVIEQGKVVFHKVKEGGVERIVVCAPIKIGEADYYMGVMLQRDARYQRLYLHNVVSVAIEREATSSSKDNLVTTGALENENHLSITSIIQKALNVKAEKLKSAKKPAEASSGSAWIINEKSGGRTPSANANALAGTPKANSRSSTDHSITDSAKNVNRDLPKILSGNADVDTDTRYAIKYPNFSETDISRNMDAIADMEAVADIDASKLEKTGKSPRTIFEEFFASIGNLIYSDVYGDISLGKSSVKSEIRHGITAEKIASIEAIPTVIEQGKVIFHKIKEGGVERIVVCAPIKIGEADYYMGVMLQRDAQTQYLYLHNVAIEKEAQIASETHRLTTGVTESDSRLFITSILKKALNVKAEKQKSAKKLAEISARKENKSRVNDWLKVNRLQLPLPNAQSHSATDSITEKSQIVNSNSPKNAANRAVDTADHDGSTSDKNREDPAHFILRLKSLKKAAPTYDLAGSSDNSITDSAENVNRHHTKSSAENAEVDTDTRFALSKGKAERLKNDLVKLGTLGIRLDAGGKSIRILTDKFTQNKNVFSHKGRNMREVNARIQAIPHFAEILRSCIYDGTDTEIHGLENEAKKGVVAMHRFKGSYGGFDIEAVVRDKGAKQFLYEIKFIEKEKSPQQSMTDESASPAPLGDAENGSIITHSEKKSNTPGENSSKNPPKNFADLSAQNQGNNAPELTRQGKRTKKAATRTNNENAQATDDLPRITSGMSDDERYEILKDKDITISAKTDRTKLESVMSKLDIAESALDLSKYGDKKRLFKKLEEEFGVFRQYNNPDTGVTFSFSKGGMSESAGKQRKGYMRRAKLLTCMDGVIENAVGIEVHNRNDEGYKADSSLKNVYVFVSAFVDGENIIPVKIEVKEFSDKENTLYAAIALESIKKNEIVKQEVVTNGVARQYSPSFTIRIADFLRKINPSDESFYKYIPKRLLEVSKEEKSGGKIGYALDSDEFFEYTDGESKEGGFNHAGSKDAGILAEREISTAGRGRYGVWKQGQNPEEIYQRLADSQNGEGGGGATRAGSSGWLEDTRGYKPAVLRLRKGILRNLRRRRLSGKDTVGRVLPSSVEKVFSESVFKNENGDLLSLYHWTDAEFRNFAKGDVGFHLGTLGASHRRYEGVVERKPIVQSFYKECYVNITSPAVINFDPMTWDVFPTAYKLNEQGIITDEEISTLKGMNGYLRSEYHSPASIELRKILGEKGYDGIIYSNSHEGGLSVIAFESNQIYTVAENGVDLEENNGDLSKAKRYALPYDDETVVDGDRDGEASTLERKRENFEYIGDENKKGGSNNAGSKDAGILAEREISTAGRGQDGVWKQGQNPEEIYQRLADSQNGERRYGEAWAGSSGGLEDTRGYQPSVLRLGKGLLRNLRRRQLSGKGTADRELPSSDHSRKKAVDYNDSDKVTISKGQAEKIRANYNSDKVFNRKDVAAALYGIEGFSNLPDVIRNELFRDVWIGLNSRYDDKSRKIFVETMRDKIPHILFTKAYTAENIKKYRQLLKEERTAKKKLHGKALENEQTRIARALKALEDSPDRLFAGYDQKRKDEITVEIAGALNKLREGGKPSKLAKIKSEFDTSYAGFWKSRYQEVIKRNRQLGLLMSKAQKMKDLKLGTFENSTQHDSEIFKNSIEQLARIQFRGNLNVSGTRKILADLRQWYTSDAVKTGILEYVDANSTGLYVQGVADMLETLSEGKKGFTLDDLKMLSDVMSYFTNFVETWGKVFRRGKWIEAEPEAKRYINTLHANEKLKVGLFSKLAGTTYTQTFADPMTVARRMDMYESGFYTEMMQELRDAAVDAQVAEMELRSAYEAFTKQHKKYVEKASVETVTYRDTKIPKMHLIGLYMTMKRKHAWAGLAANGFTFTDTKGKRVRVNGVVSPEAKITAAELEQLTKYQLSAIEALLTDTDKEYIAILEQAYNVDARKLKADRDMQRLGFTNATNDYYYPIRRGNIAKNVDTADIVGELDRVSHSSFNKDTVRGAKQELFIESADIVFNRHIRAVCQYAYLSPAVETYNRLYNLDISGNKNKPISVATESANTWNKGNKYFEKLISDIQGIPASSAEGMRILGRVRGNYAKFQLGANPKVWFTQLSSIFASTSLLDADSITRGMAVSAKGIDQYCPLAKLRNNDNTAAMAEGVLDSKAKRAGNAVGKFSDLLMTPIGKMDRFTICRLFGACQVQVEKNGGSKVGAEANKVEAGKLLRTVILETQQNTIATERSAATRSGNEIVRTLTMFRSDAIKVMGRVIDGIGEISVLRAKLKATTDADARSVLKQQLKSANRKTRKAVSALALSAVFMASIAQLFRWLYDKEQDEDESVAETMLVDAVGTLFSGLPIFSDILSKATDGYDLDNYTYSAFNDLLDSVFNVFDLAGSLANNEASAADKNRAVRNLAYSVGQILGIPVRNVYNVFFGLTKRFNPEAAYVIDNAFYEKNYRNELYKAIEEDDAEMTSFIMSLLLGERMNENVDEAVFNELLILSKNGQKVIPGSVPSKITIDEVEYPLSAEEQAAIKDIYATSERSLKALFAKSKYNTLSDEQKAEAIDFIYDTYYDKALEGALGIDRGNNSLIIADVVGVDNLALLYVTTKGLTSDTDRRGNVISGSKRKKVVAAINALGVSTEKKLLLICAKGYSLQDNDIRGLSAAKAKKYLLRYILSLKGKTKAEKAEIAELCGFEVENGKIMVKTSS